jgi:hypothetical protein
MCLDDWGSVPGKSTFSFLVQLGVFSMLICKERIWTLPVPHYGSPFPVLLTCCWLVTRTGFSWSSAGYSSLVFHV